MKKFTVPTEGYDFTEKEIWASFSLQINDIAFSMQVSPEDIVAHLLQTTHIAGTQLYSKKAVARFFKY